MKIEIKKGIPIPVKKEKYPFRDMEIGDCFEFPKEKYNTINSACQFYAKKHNVKFTVRNIDGNIIGVWRIK